MVTHKPANCISVNGNSDFTVTMTDLDTRLSEWVDKARNVQPVLVNRYGVPWIWIVSHPIWEEIDYLSSFVPPEHPLVELREDIDSAMAFGHAAIADFSQQNCCQTEPRILIRAWLLQLVYSLTSAEQLLQALSYNMLWRWFVGYSRVSEDLPKKEFFINELEQISAYPSVIELVDNCLKKLSFLHDDGWFRVNHGLLHALRVQYRGK